MHSASVALLEAIDQRLCALIYRTDTGYIGVSFEDLQKEYNDPYTIKIERSAGSQSIKNFETQFNAHDGLIWHKDGTCVLSVADRNTVRRVIRCISNPQKVKAFIRGLYTTEDSWVSVTDDKCLVNNDGNAIQFE